MKICYCSVVLCLFLWGKASGQDFDPNFTPLITSDHDVSDWEVLEMEDGSLLAGGNFFFTNGTRTNRICKLDGTGKLDPSFQIGLGFDDRVSKMIPTDDGKIFVAGAFRQYNGQQAGGILRLLPDGRVDESFHTGTGFNGPVNGLVQLSDGALVLTGNFTTYNEQTVSSIAKLLPDGSLDLNFNTGGAGMDGSVSTMAKLSGDKLILGMRNTASYNNERGPLVRIFADGSVDDGFKAFEGIDIRRLVGDILVRSDFSFVVHGVCSGSFCEKVVVISEDGGLIEEIERPNDDILSIAGPDVFDNIYLNVRGFIPEFDSYVEEIFQYTPQGNFFLESAIGMTGRPFRVVKALKDTTLLLKASTYKEKRPSLIKYKPDGSFDLDFVTTLESPGGIEAFAVQEDGQVFILGDFEGVENTYQQNLARVLSDGSLDTAFTPDIPGEAELGSMAVQTDGKLIVGTDLSNGGGIYRLQESGTLDTSFNFPTTKLANAGSINRIKILVDGRIVVAGDRISLLDSFSESRGVLWLNPDGSLDDPMTKALTATSVWDLHLLPDNSLLLGGEKIHYEDHDPVSLIKIMADDTRDASFARVDLKTNITNPSLLNTIAIEKNGNILLGGYFNTLNGLSVPSGILSLLPDGSLNENSGLGSGVSSHGTIPGTVSAIEALKNGYTLVSGSFDRYNGIPVQDLILLDENKQLIKSFPLYLAGGITEIEENEHGIFLSGSFLTDSTSTATALVKLDLGTVPVREINQPDLDLFRVYPTQTNSDFTIEVHPEFGEKPYTVNLFDLNGYLLKSWKGGSSIASFSLPSQLPAGTFYLQLRNGLVQQTRRIFKR